METPAAFDWEAWNLDETEAWQDEWKQVRSRQELRRLRKRVKAPEESPRQPKPAAVEDLGCRGCSAEAEQPPAPASARSSGWISSWALGRTMGWEVLVERTFISVMPKPNRVLRSSASAPGCLMSFYQEGGAESEMAPLNCPSWKSTKSPSSTTTTGSHLDMDCSSSSSSSSSEAKEVEEAASPPLCEPVGAGGTTPDAPGAAAEAAPGDAAPDLASVSTCNVAGAADTPKATCAVSSSSTVASALRTKPARRKGKKARSSQCGTSSEHPQLEDTNSVARELLSSAETVAAVERVAASALAIPRLPSDVVPCSSFKPCTNVARMGSVGWTGVQTRVAPLWKAAWPMAQRRARSCCAVDNASVALARSRTAAALCDRRRAMAAQFARGCFRWAETLLNRPPIELIYMDRGTVAPSCALAVEECASKSHRHPSVGEPGFAAAFAMALAQAAPGSRQQSAAMLPGPASGQAASPVLPEKGRAAQTSKSGRQRRKSRAAAS